MYRESWPQGQLTTDSTPIAGVYVKPTPKILIGLVRGRIGLIPRLRPVPFAAKLARAEVLSETRLDQTALRIGR
jgi:hypothetical protein